MPEVPVILYRRRSNGRPRATDSRAVDVDRPGAWFPHTPTGGVTLIELLCVMAIIAILMSLIAPAAFKALRKARQLAGEIQRPAFQEELQRKYTPYRLAHPNHPTLDREAFIQACGLSSKAAAWLTSSEVRFTPFSGTTPATSPVIEHRLTLVANQPAMIVYTVVDLLLPEPQ